MKKVLLQSEEYLQKWNEHKIQLNKRTKIPYFKEWHIFYTSIWVNIWFEQNGKWQLFNRPTIILKKFNKNTFYGIPLTSKPKKWKYYFEFEFIPEKKSYAILSQLRLYDAKRLKKKIWFVSESLLKEIREQTKKLF
jgi:hypothetical protein